MDSNEKSNNSRQFDRNKLLETFVKNDCSLDGIDERDIMRFILQTCQTRRNAAVDIDGIVGRLGSVRRLLYAADEELGGEKGLSCSEILRLRVIGSMFKLVQLQKLGKKIRADDEERIAKYLSVLCLSHSVEVLYILPVVGKFIKEPFLLSSGTETAVDVSAEGILSVLRRVSGCEELILAHSHPFESSVPSKKDIWETEVLFGILFREGYLLREHYVVGNDGVRRVPYDKNPLRYYFGGKGG